jgi:hypothetical protein
MKRKRKEADISPEEQIRRWVAGDSVHNTRRDECCPDFLCCQPKNLAPRDVRERFSKAGIAERNTTCMGFLAGMLRKRGHEVVTA